MFARARERAFAPYIRYMRIFRVHVCIYLSQYMCVCTYIQSAHACVYICAYVRVILMKPRALRDYDN